jgi:rifampicin phosphotransferase
MTQTESFSSTWILPLTSDQAVLRVVGGKGANLSRLVRAGFNVPGGFLVTTQAYHDFAAANRLEEKMPPLLSEAAPDDPDALQSLSARIRALFAGGTIPEALAVELRQAYQDLSRQSQGEKAVAVRSSATAEDLPEMSFAGQQDTYLNVVGPDAFLKAVVDCWSSLWTGRAIGYRSRNGVAHTGAALAVVVQEMVESQASGVLFTANPLSGLRAETVIDAALGLGEALVSGQVEPDHYVVDPARGQIISKTLGAKMLSIHGRPEGGTRVTEQKRSEVQALPDEQILALARLGSQVADLYGFPQDIEWAWAENSLYLLQTRPVTSLFPLPDGLPPEPLKVFFSFAAVQGMLDPVTPLGRDALQEIFAVGASLFGIRVTRRTQSVLYVAGERLWVNFTPVLSNSVGRRIVPVVLSLVEPTIRQAVEQIEDDPRLQPGRQGISFHARLHIARFLIPMAANVLRNLAAPGKRRTMIIERGEDAIKLMKARCDRIEGDRWQKLSKQAALLPNFAAEKLPSLFLLFISGVASGMASWNFLNMLAGSAAKDSPPSTPYAARDLVLQVTRGMPYNPTTEMDLALWELAKWIQSDPASRQAFENRQAAELTASFRARELPLVAMQRVSQFLQRYGGRGLGEIDLGRKRWADDPTYVFEMLAGYLKIDDDAHAPDAVFARGSASAEQAIAQLGAALRQTRHGWLKARLLRFFAGRTRQLMGMRESPKFFAVRLMWLVQRELLKTGAEFVEAGDLVRADDLVYLTLSELQAFSAHQAQDWRGLIDSRRQAYQRELLRRQIPRLLLSDGRAFYEGMSQPENAENAMQGSPVSPGSVEGKVRVVLDPRQAGLLHGEILVCPGTDPSWTPLFLSAGGLIMEVGGMMTHGAVVAREYGIPAIVGVDQATTRLKTGQVIRMNGSSGQIVIVEEVGDFNHEEHEGH